MQSRIRCDGNGTSGPFSKFEHRKLVLQGEPQSNDNEDSMEQEEWQLIVDFIRRSTSLQDVVFIDFYWTEEEDIGIGGMFPLDFGLVAEDIRESVSITDVAFEDCDFSTPAQILHFKSMLENSFKPRSLILLEFTGFEGSFGNEIFGNENEQDEDMEMEKQCNL
jgi:hypothetical protein